MDKDTIPAASQKWGDKIRELKEEGVQGDRTCPLLSGIPCDKGRCAWWNHIDEECCVATLGTLATIDIGGRQR